jgi:hypothetical protein
VISAIGSYLGQLRILSEVGDSRRGLEPMNTEIQESTAFEIFTRKRLVKAQQTEKKYYTL